MRMFRLGIVALFSVTTFATPTWANKWEDEVKAKLFFVALTAGLGASAKMTHDPYTGMLGNDASETKVLQLQRETDYAIVAVGDEDCKDLDLRLVDENGNEASKDIEEDSFPVVTVTPKWTGKFYLQVKMARCVNAPCHYGIGVFGK